MKRNSVKRRSTVLALCLVFLLALQVAPLGAWAQNQSSGDSSLMEEVKAYLEAFYVNDLDAGKLGGKTVDEVISQVGDPYTTYFLPKEFDRFIESVNGTFGGVGIQIEQVGDYVTVVAPLKNTPGERAGVKAGDKIIAVNGQSLIGSSADQAAALIRGEPGTRVTLRIQRDEVTEPFDVTITREMINVLGTEWEVLEGTVGYLRLHTFGETTGDEVKKALDELAAKGVKSLILDVRGNPGGMLDTAVEVAGNFIPPAPVVHVVWKDGKETISAEKTAGRPLLLPLVVLVDGGSASASEILAGAIKDWGMGKIVGTTTFGKGSVQTLFKLSGGGVLKVTTAKYQTPSGRFVDGEGIEPDYLVAGEDTQLDYALELLGVDRERLVTLVIDVPRAQVAGKEVPLETPPFIDGERTYVPLRFVSEALGAVVSWDHEQQLATVRLGKTRVELAPGQPEARVDGVAKAYDVPALLRENAVFVPLRLVAEALGAKVKWENDTRTVTITQ